MSKSSTITTVSDWLRNPHPGEILLEELLKPMGLSQNALARAIHVPPRRVIEIVLGKRAVTADTRSECVDTITRAANVDAFRPCSATVF